MDAAQVRHGDVSVHLRRLGRRVAEQLLDLAQPRATFQEVGGVGVSERVGVGLADARAARAALEQAADVGRAEPATAHGEQQRRRGRLASGQGRPATYLTSGA